jgi:hydrogenase/urease accessory protein HupE
VGQRRLMVHRHRHVVRLSTAVGLVATVLLASATPSYAHGIGGVGSHMSVWAFVPVGIEHMLFGWDHLLFIAGVVLLAARVGRAAKLITVFVLGHSTTLILATLMGWRVNATAVDIVIALSVVFVGFVALRGRPQQWWWFGLAVFGFGLVHGLGLSTRLQDLGLPQDGLLLRVIAFNVGVEIGQLSAIAAMVAIGILLRGVVTRPAVYRAAGGVLVVTGMIAASVLFVVGSDQPGTGEQAVAAESPVCTAAKRTESFDGFGAHPAKDFYGPAEAIPSEDFGHVIGDGYVIVVYNRDLPKAQVKKLQRFVSGPDGGQVVAGADSSMTDGAALKAINVEQTLTCQRADVAALHDFTGDWFAALG